MSTTTVTGTVVDPDSIAWANGTAIFQLVNPNPNIQPSVNGVPLTAGQQTIVVTLDGTGSFSQAVTSSASIVPAQTLWEVTFYPNTSAPGQSLLPQQINGGSLSLNTQIAAQIGKIRLAPTSLVRAYADGEIMAPVTAGAQYWNSASNTTRVFNGSGWTSGGGGGSSSFRQVYLSSISGMVLDCVPSTGQKVGGGTPTDNTTVLNNYLASVGGVNNPVEIIIDGGFACKGIVLPAAGYISLRGLGWGTGVFILSGSNADPINNGSNPFQPTGTPPATGGPVYLQNFYVNGNRGNGTTGNSNSGNPRGTGSYWYCNITLYGVTGVYIRDMYLYDAPAYSIRLLNCNQGWVQNNVMYNPNATAGVNNDGFHGCAPLSDFWIENNLIVNNNSDDGVALNSPEGYPNSSIDRITVANNDLVAVLHGMRVYGASATGNTVGTVEFIGNNVIASTAGVWIGVAVAGGADQSGTWLNISNNRFNLTGTSAACVRVDSSVGDIMMDNNIWDSPPNANCYFFLIEIGTVSNLTMHNCKIYRTTAGNANPVYFIGDFGASTIKRCTVDNPQILNQSGQSYSAVPVILGLVSCTIQELLVGIVDWTNITTLTTSWANVTAVTGNYQNKQTIPANKTGAYTVVQWDYYLRGDATSAAFAFTLPAAPYTFEEHEFIKVDSSANAITFAGNGKTINNSPSLSTQWSHAKLRYNGTTWDSL